MQNLAIVLLLAITGTIRAADIRYAGVNLSGAEFGSALPGTFNTDYTYPNQSEVDYFKRRGMNTVRLCFRWERLQQTLNASFNPAESNRFHTFVTQTTAKGMHVILDPHNYARYNNVTIGAAGTPVSAFTNFWGRLATLYKTNQQVIFGLVNEPHTMATEAWVTAAQAAINSIRAAGATNLILVPGNAWSGAHSWLQNWYGTPNATAMLAITDPANNYAFEVHQYLDADSSGTSATIVSPTIGRERLVAFTDWCRANNKRAFLGEFAVANSSVRDGIGDEALTNMLAYIRANSDIWLGWTWWAAGPWWGNYMFTLEPTGNFTTDQPAMAPLRAFIPIPSPTLKIASTNTFNFPTWPGFNYQPQFTTNLTIATWTNQGAELAGNGQTNTATLTATDSTRFYRVQIRLGP